MFSKVGMPVVSVPLSMPISEDLHQSFSYTYRQLQTQGDFNKIRMSLFVCPPLQLPFFLASIIFLAFRILLSASGGLHPPHPASSRLFPLPHQLGRSNGFLLALSCSGYLSFSPFLSSISTFLNTLVLAIYYHTGKRTLGCKVSWLLLAVSLSHKDLKIYQKWNTSACVCKFGCVDLNMPSANLLHLFFFFSRLMLPFNSTTNYLTLLTSLVQLRVPRFSTKRTTYSSHFPGRIPKKGPSIEFVQDYRLFSQASRI